MFNKKNIITLPVIVVCCVFSMGCPDSGGRYSVTGTVRVNGEPVKDGSISFVPVDINAAHGGSGAAILGGKYSISKKEGLFPGEYKVQLFATADSGRVRETPNPITGEKSPIRMHIIPERYNLQTTLKETIEPKKNTFDYDLTVDESEFRDLLF